MSINDNQIFRWQEAPKRYSAYDTIHDAPPITLNDDLSKDASQCARKLLDIRKLVHSKGK